MRGLLGFALALALVGCGSFEPDMASLEQDIEGDLADQIDDDEVTLDCPESIDWKAGDEFYCIATDSTGQTARVTVAMQNDDGEYVWTLN